VGGHSIVEKEEKMCRKNGVFPFYRVTGMVKGMIRILLVLFSIRFFVIDYWFME